jgi:hypothetical protein
VATVKTFDAHSRLSLMVSAVDPFVAFTSARSWSYVLPGVVFRVGGLGCSDARRAGDEFDGDGVARPREPQHDGVPAARTREGHGADGLVRDAGVGLCRSPNAYADAGGDVHGHRTVVPAVTLRLDSDSTTAKALPRCGDRVAQSDSPMPCWRRTRCWSQPRALLSGSRSRMAATAEPRNCARVRSGSSVCSPMDGATCRPAVPVERERRFAEHVGVVLPALVDGDLVADVDAVRCRRSGTRPTPTW